MALLHAHRLVPLKTYFIDAPTTPQPDPRFSEQLATCFHFGFFGSFPGLLACTSLSPTPSRYFFVPPDILPVLKQMVL